MAGRTATSRDPEDPACGAGESLGCLPSHFLTYWWPRGGRREGQREGVRDSLRCTGGCSSWGAEGSLDHFDSFGVAHLSQGLH